jgi:outer membrane protein assembly factor BamB
MVLMLGCEDILAKSSLNIQPIWSVQIGKGAGQEYVQLQPALNHNRIYTASADGVILAMNTDSSEPIWKTELKLNLSSGVAFGEGLIVVGTPDGHVIAMRKEDGDDLWETQLEGEIIAPATVYQDHVFVKTAAGVLYALESMTGNIAWHYTLSTPELKLRVNTAPKVVNNEVIVGFSDGEVVALNAKNGSPKWKVRIAHPKGLTEIERMVDVSANQIASNKVYAVSYHGKLSAIDKKTGNEIWSHQLSSYTGMTIQDNCVYVSDTDSHVWAFDADTGKVLWHQNELQGLELTSPTVMGKTLVMGDSAGYVHWVSREDGQILARLRADSSRILTPPITDGQQAYVYTAQGELIKYTVFLGA